MFFHVSLELDKDIKEFKKYTKIPVAERLPNALGTLFKKEEDFANYFNTSYFGVFKVYEFNKEDILPENLKSTKELYEKDLVRSAPVTKEKWIVNQSIKPINSYFIVANTDDYYVLHTENISFESRKKINCIEDYSSFTEGFIDIIRVTNWEEIPLGGVEFTKEVIIDIENTIGADQLEYGIEFMESFLGKNFLDISVKDETKFIVKLKEEMFIPINYIKSWLIRHMVF